jgi:NAD(P)-dependent dehydrogenase (short-subunit alcohol dehydrogenase family)
MENDVRFDGRVAIVTGAGRGLGLSHARALAARGAKVVVNDFGSHGTGVGSSPERAHEGVAAIVADGGEAVAHFGDVSDPDDANALVAKAIDSFGRIDIVVNNAGFARFVTLATITSAQFNHFLQVHLLGSLLVTQAAWPQMVDQGYGRVVLTSSSGMFGVPNNACYDAAKGGVYGLMKSLSVEGRSNGILVNGILPSANTPLRSEMVEGTPADSSLAELPDYMQTLMRLNESPDLVAPIVCWLSHESCQTTGEAFHAGAGWVSKLLMSQGRGFADAGLTPEKVRDNWDAVCHAEPYTPITDGDSAVRGLAEAASKALGC